MERYTILPPFAIVLENIRQMFLESETYILKDRHPTTGEILDYE